MAALLHTQPAQRLGVVQLGHLREEGKIPRVGNLNPSKGMNGFYMSLQDHHLEGTIWKHNDLLMKRLAEIFPKKQFFNTAHVYKA